MKSNLSIYIENEPSGFKLASDGIFYGAYIAMRGCDTLVYKSIKAALKRLNSKQPRKSIPVKLYPNACLHVCITNRLEVGRGVEYFLDRDGNRITIKP